MATGLSWSVRVPTGARLTMLPPGISAGAESSPDVYRIYRHDPHARYGKQYSGYVVFGVSARTFPRLGLKKGVFIDTKSTKQV